MDITDRFTKQDNLYKYTPEKNTGIYYIKQKEYGPVYIEASIEEGYSAPIKSIDSIFKAGPVIFEMDIPTGLTVTLSCPNEVEKATWIE